MRWGKSGGASLPIREHACTQDKTYKGIHKAVELHIGAVSASLVHKVTNYISRSTAALVNQ